jgi:beta-lactam-binding protein with PASTA domain
MTSYGWLLPFICFVAGYTGARLSFGPSGKAMPNVVGKSAHEALGILSTYTLNARVLAYKNEPDIAPGTILSQTPPAGRTVKPHQSIFLILAQEPEKSVMPSAVQRRITEINTELSSQGIAPLIYYLPHPWPPDTCFAQWPVAGDIVSKTSKPILYVSATEQKSIVWPSYIGLAVQPVVDFLKRKNIIPDIVHTDHNADSIIYTGYHIVDQRPLAGSLIDITKPEKLSVQLRIA